MRRYIPIAAALAVVVLLGVAIVASGEVLSFSVPGAGDSVVERVPADQSQPQDFDDAGSQYYYFGPDFMCQIYSDTTIECFGSDANDVISNVPRGTGFTNIDGGDTYACAFHEASLFTYCWGSITRRPSTIQPTATATSVPTATATTLPPGVTPEPTATATAVPADPCELQTPDLFALPLTLEGSWIEECEYPVESDDFADGIRYYRWVGVIPILASGSWTATLTSETADTYMILWEYDSDTDELTYVSENDDIVPGNTNSRIQWTPVSGQGYVLDLTTYTSNTLGNFTLTIEQSTSNSQGQSSSGDQSTGQTIEGALPSERRQ